MGWIMIIGSFMKTSGYFSYILNNKNSINMCKLLELCYHMNLEDFLFFAVFKIILTFLPYCMF